MRLAASAEASIFAIRIAHREKRAMRRVKRASCEREEISLAMETPVARRATTAEAADGHARCLRNDERPELLLEVELLALLSSWAVKPAPAAYSMPALSRLADIRRNLASPSRIKSSCMVTVA